MAGNSTTTSAVINSMKNLVYSLIAALLVAHTASAKPALDQKPPKGLETATFGLG